MAFDQWYQQALTPPTVVEINIRLGLIPEQDHGQWLCEVKDPTTGLLLGQVSGPHFAIATLPEVLATVLAKVQALADEHVPPFA